MREGHIYEVMCWIRISPRSNKLADEAVEELLHPVDIEEVDDSGEYKLTYRVPVWFDPGIWSPESAALEKTKRLLEAELAVQDATPTYLEVTCGEWG